MQKIKRTSLFCFAVWIGLICLKRLSLLFHFDLFVERSFVLFGATKFGLGIKVCSFWSICMVGCLFVYGILLRWSFVHIYVLENLRQGGELLKIWLSFSSLDSTSLILLQIVLEASR